MTWVEDVQNMLNNVTYDNLPTLRPIPSIYKVPDFLRNMNHQAYTPQLISIGPFHYGSQKLQLMKECKEQCFKFFIEKHDVNLNILETYMAESEGGVRYSYAEDIPIQKIEFRNMILLDASFIIVLFLKTWNQYYTAGRIHIQSWMIAKIQLDLILLENQLPFSFIEHLYDRFVNGYQSLCPTFMKLTFDYFDCFNTQKLPPDISSSDVNHFADLLRHFYLFPRGRIPERITKVGEMFCASKLAETGMKFRPSSTDRDCLLNLKCSSGVLIIPKFNLNNDTEICARNVVALEECHYREDAYVTDYFFMLGLLIHERSDMDLLVREGIIVKRPNDNVKATLPNDLCTSISSSKINKEYHFICEESTKFYHKRWYYVLGSTLRQDYFNTPWMGAASFGAIILLFFTLIQTVCSVLQTYKQFKNES